MKKALSVLLTLGLVIGLGSCSSFQTIKGDGNLVTEEIDINSYDAIELAGGTMKVFYVQSEEAAGLTVTVDRNILDKFRFETKNNRLRIRPEKEYQQAHFRPTEFTVRTNSNDLQKLGVAGNVNFLVNSPLITEKLEIEVSGSGEINLNDTVRLERLSLSLAGSGTLNAPAFYGGTFSAHIAGSGKINLGGVAQKSSFEIAGSGTVRAFDLQVEEAKCQIAGSGDMEISVSGKIDLEVAGSGHVKYKGNPSKINQQVAGSGSIKKVE
ncbi:MAG: DUF2807 domain-containing protein [Tannerellaceae bacterium]|jgi:hypothetical protein|nr:DUF2807 domain-containing protein [Tannerellaceae bacterium]